MKGCTLDVGHQLALSIAINHWRAASMSVRHILDNVLAHEDLEADELRDRLDALERGLQALHDDYIKARA